MPSNNKQPILFRLPGNVRVIRAVRKKQAVSPFDPSAAG
jgi:hypothetical protein